jgi:glutamate--cysteine ligase
MHWSFSEITKYFLNKDKTKLLSEGNFGVEKESQRTTLSGNLALTPHPAVFGDKCENQRITTDFSESQIEIITPPFKSVEEVYDSLKEIQIEVEKGIGNELLWPLSMPPRLPKEKLIPIAKFSSSKECRRKEIYRNGLALRYGKKMQMISGIHYNFSFGEGIFDFLYEHWGSGKDKRGFIDTIYFAVTRNFLRYRWLLIYLFGASPSCDHTYYSVICRELLTVQKCCPDCYGAIKDFKKYSTSLRVSRFGYSDTIQNRHNLYFNNMDEYSRELQKILSTESPEYLKLGLYKNGEQIQLNGNVLQSESEFYSSVRLKQNIRDGETQLEALVSRGVKYIEIRILDINPFEKLGMSIDQLYFMQVFMIYCLFENSKPIAEEEYNKINSNHHLAAILGRKEDLMLYSHDNGSIPLRDFGEKIFEKCRYIAELMDKDSGSYKYKQSVEKQYQKLLDKTLLPSERIYREMKEKNESFLEFGIRQAINNSQKV